MPAGMVSAPKRCRGNEPVTSGNVCSGRHRNFHAGASVLIHTRTPLRCVMMVRRFSRVLVATSLCLLGILFLLVHRHHRPMRWRVIAASMPNGTDMPNGGMAHMAGHMYMT